MKILLDPTLTAHPSGCSNTVVFAEFVKRTLNERDDVMFYWIVPNVVDDEHFEWYPQHPKIKYLRHERVGHDRIHDYLFLTPEMQWALAFNGECWDFDVLVTNRAMQVPAMRLLMNSPRQKKNWWMKQVWIIETMPMVTFKTTVPTMVPGVHDRATIEGYLAADNVWVTSYHERPEILREARRHFAPSHVMTLQNRLRDVVTAQFEEYRLKSPEQMFVPGGRLPFGLGYVGRMEKANKIDEINDVMVKSWIPRGSQVYLLACTVSKVIRTFDEDIVDVRFPAREEFWRIVQEEMHAFLKMPAGTGFSLSLIEPVMLGTPVVTLRTQAYESMLGPDYPFFADGPAQVPGLVKALFDDYAEQYARFARWQEESFRPLYRKRFAEDLIYDHMATAIDSYQQMLVDRQEKLRSLAGNMIVVRLSELLGTTYRRRRIRTVFDGIRVMHDLKELDALWKQTRPEDKQSRGVVWSTPWHPIRVGLQQFYGFRDASTELGHLERVS